MISSSEDVYRELIEESEESWLYGLVAFAVVEERRIEWMKHRADTTGVLPDAEQIREWYDQLPPGELLRAKGEAEGALAEYAGRVEEELLERHGQEIRDGTIVSEIRLGQRFWPQFAINFAGGLASAVMFAAILAILAFFILMDKPSIEDLAKGPGNLNGEAILGQDKEQGSNE